MSDQGTIEKCVKCDSELLGPYCSSCGHAREIPRINGRYILFEIGSILNFHKGDFIYHQRAIIETRVERTKVYPRR